MQTEGSLAIPPRGRRSAETRKHQGNETYKTLGSLPCHCLLSVLESLDVWPEPGWHFLEF